MSFILPPAPPAPTEMPNRDLVSSWHAGSMAKYLDLLDRHGVAKIATRADKLVADGATHLRVLSALAGAESSAPDDERHLHAARTDAYAAHYGLRGWYRYRGERGEHRVAVNYLRTAADGDVDRHYVHRPLISSENWVMDRDTGQVAARAPYRHAADEWIARAEGTAVPALPKDWPPPVPHWTDRDIRTVELAGVTR